MTLQLWCLTVPTKPKGKPLVYLKMTLSTVQGICLGRQHPTLSMQQCHSIEKSIDAFKLIDLCLFCKHLEKKKCLFSCTCGFGYIVRLTDVSFLCGRKIELCLAVFEYNSPCYMSFSSAKLQWKMYLDRFFSMLKQITLAKWLFQVTASMYLCWHPQFPWCSAQQPPD